MSCGNTSPSFDIQTEGPGPVDLHPESSQDELSQVQVLARQAGAYSFTLTCSATQQMVGGRPVQVSIDFVFVVGICWLV